MKKVLMFTLLLALALPATSQWTDRGNAKLIWGTSITAHTASDDGKCLSYDLATSKIVWKACVASETDGVIGNEVTNATDATLTRSGSGTAGSPYTLGLNLANANTWTATQTFATAAFADGASGTPSITFASATGLGFYKAGTSMLGFGTADVGMYEDGIVLPAANYIRWSSTSVLTGTQDLQIRRDAAYTMQWGVDSATPSDYTLKGTDGSGTDIVGGDLTIAPGHGTGTAEGGDLILSADAGRAESGATPTTATPRMRIFAKKIAMADAGTVNILGIANPTADTSCMAEIIFGYQATSGTDTQYLLGHVTIGSYNDDGTVTASVTEHDTKTAGSGGSTVTSTWAAAVANTNVTVTGAFDTSLSATGTLTYNVVYNSGCTLSLPGT